MKEFFSRLFDFVIRPSSLVAVLVVTGILLVLPEGCLTRLRLEQTMIDYGWCVGIAFLVSGVILLINAGTWGLGRARDRRLLTQRRARMAETIRTLDSAEIAVLREFSIQGRNSVLAPIDDAVVAGLMRKGIIQRVGGFGEHSPAGMVFPVTLSSLAEEIHTSDIVALPDNPTADERQQIIRSRPRWVLEIERWRRMFEGPLLD
jgi:hypothetical protein